MLSLYTLTQRDIETRKNWLHTTIILYTFPILKLIVDFFIIDFYIKNVVASQSEVIYFFGTLFLGLCTGSLSFFIIYHCAYVKNGTAYLTFHIGLTIFLFFIFSYLYISKSELYYAIGFYKFLLLSFLTLSWMIQSFKLRKLNRKVLIGQQTEVYSLLHSTLYSTSDFASLNEKFHYLVHKYPAYEPILEDVYQEKKNLLAS